MAKKIDLNELKSTVAGSKCGELTIVDIYRYGKKNDIHYRCICTCGTETKTRRSEWGIVKSCGCKTRAYNDENLAAFNAVYYSYQRSAKVRKLAFELSENEFAELTQQKCIYCNNLPATVRKTTNGKYVYNGIDRLDNNIGYLYDNCATACKRCNFLKGTLNSGDFIEAIAQILRNNQLNIEIKPSKLNSYYKRALATASSSHDEQTKVGALLINPKSGAVIAEGYNGFVRGARDQELPKTRPEKYPYMVHAEMNLLCNAVRHGICTDNCVVFCTLSPCISCIRMLYQSGISTVYFKDMYSDIERSINMGDLILTITEIDEFYKITVEPNT